MRADRVFLGQGIGVFLILHLALFAPICSDFALFYFRPSSQHVYRAPRQCVVRERHAAYVRL